MRHKESTGQVWSALLCQKVKSKCQEAVDTEATLKGLSLTKSQTILKDQNKS